MVDKIKDKKVIGIRKDVIIEDPENRKPVPEIVAVTKKWYEEALTGNLRTFAFSACVEDTIEPNFGIVGEYEFHWTLMHAQLTALYNEYYLNNVLPALTGIYPEDFYDDE